MKAIQWIILFFLSAVGAEMLHAQGIRVYKKDGTVQTLPYSEVDSLVAYSSTGGGGPIAGHDHVDLGLSVKWATCNVGAISPSDYGDYYAWGEVSPKWDYTEANSVTWKIMVNNIAGDPQYDAARANWGGIWRLPTKTECEELVNECTWTWTEMGGKNGYKVTGKNGNSIFLPAAGWRYGTSLLGAGEYGRCWSSTPDEDSGGNAYNLRFLSGYRRVDWSGRYYGCSVRPVSE